MYDYSNGSFPPANCGPRFQNVSLPLSASYGPIGPGQQLDQRFYGAPGPPPIGPPMYMNGNGSLSNLPMHNVMPCQISPTNSPPTLAPNRFQPQMHVGAQNGGHTVIFQAPAPPLTPAQLNRNPNVPYVATGLQQTVFHQQQQHLMHSPQQHGCGQMQFMCCDPSGPPPNEIINNCRTGFFYRNRMPGVPPPPPPPQYFGLDYKIHEMNKRLQHRTNDLDNASLWWDAFVTEFFEDDATLTLSFNLDKGPQRYTIGRLLIPRYFRTIFEGGAVQMYYQLNVPTREFFEQGRGMMVLDCENAVMVAHYNKAMTNVHTEGRLICEFSTFPSPMGDELLPGRIRSWHFFVHHHTEFIPRSLVPINNMDQATVEQVAQSITVQGFMKTTLSFLGICVILEPMQELMSRSRTYPNMTPRECLTTTAFQKWQEMNAIVGARQQRAAAAAAAAAAASGPGGQPAPTAHPMLPPSEEGHKPAKGRRKRKGSSGGATPTGSGPGGGGGKKKNAVSPAPAAPNFPLTSHVDVMVVSEPSLMGGEFGDEDERMISRLENTQFDPSAAAAQANLVGMSVPGPSTSLGGPMGIPLPTSAGGGLMGLQAMTQDPNIFDWPAPSHAPPPQSLASSLPQQHSMPGGGPSVVGGASSGSNPNTPIGRTATPANTNSNGSGGNQQTQSVRTPGGQGGNSSPAQPPQPGRPLSTSQNGSRQGTPNAMATGQAGNMTPTSYI